MVPIKNNLGGDQHGGGFRLLTHEFPEPLGGDPDGYPDGLRRETKVVWDDHSTQEQADALLQKLGHTPGSATASSGGRPSPAMDEAIAFLEDTLADGAKPTSEIESAAVDAGISKMTLKRAKTNLGIESRRIGFGEQAHYVWSPQADPPEPQSSGLYLDSPLRADRVGDHRRG